MVSYLPYSHFNLNNRLNFQLGNTLSEEKTFHLKKSGRMDHSFASSFPWLVASYLSVIKQRGYGGLFTFTKKDMTSQLTLPKWVIIYLTFYQRLIFQPVKLTQVYHFIFLFHKKKKNLLSQLTQDKYSECSFSLPVSLKVLLSLSSKLTGTSSTVKLVSVWQVTVDECALWLQPSDTH